MEELTFQTRMMTDTSIDSIQQSNCEVRCPKCGSTQLRKRTQDGKLVCECCDCNTTFLFES